MKIPKLRFKDFDGGWVERRLGEVTSWASGGTPSKEEKKYWEGDIPWISASSMRGLEYSDSELKLTKLGLEKGSRLAPKGSLLLLVRGSMLFNTIPIGIAGRDVAFNQDVKAIFPERETTSNFLLSWFLSNENKLLGMVVGTGIGAGKLETASLQALPLHLPTHPEQKKIANFLTQVDKKISQLSRQKQLLEQFKKGLMQRIFSREIRFLDADGRGFGEWERRKLGEVLELKYGKDQKEIACEDGKYPIFGTGGEIGRTNTFLFDKPSVLIGRKGTIDKPRFMDTPFWTVDTLFYTELSSAVFPKFIFYQFEMINWYAYNEASGVPSLSASTIGKIEIKLPPLAEQEKIATHLSQLDEQIGRVGEQLAAFRIWKRGLLREMFV